MASTPVPPTPRRSTTADLEVEERAQHLDPSSQGDGSLWDQLQAFSHETGHQRRLGIKRKVCVTKGKASLYKEQENLFVDKRLPGIFSLY